VSTCIHALLACECRSVAPGYERVSAIGEIDLATGTRLTDALRGAQARAQSVVLDLSAATFIDAGGVRILLAADTRARAASRTFAIANPTSPVERVLQLVGADRVLAILRPGILSPEVDRSGIIPVWHEEVSRPGGRTMIAASPPPQRPPVTPVSDDHLPERDAAAAEAADETEMPLPSDPRTFFLGGLFALGVFAVLYVASAIILPVVLAFVLNLLLQPAVRLLGRVHLPRAVGALLTVLLVIGVLVGLMAALSVPAATWAERLPEGIPRLEAHLKL